MPKRAAAEESADEETEFTIDASQDSFKQWVAELRAVDKELKDAGKPLSAIRKRRRALSDAVRDWMLHHEVGRVQVQADDDGTVTYLKCVEKEVLAPVNAEYLYDALLQLNNGDETLASSMVGAVYNNRPAETKVVLKAVKENDKKKPRVRDVEGSSM